MAGMRESIRKAKFMAATARTFEGLEATLAGVEEMRECLPADIEYARPLVESVARQFRMMKESIGLILAGGEDGVN